MSGMQKTKPTYKELTARFQEFKSNARTLSAWRQSLPLLPPFAFALAWETKTAKDFTLAKPLCRTHWC